MEAGTQRAHPRRRTRGAPATADVSVEASDDRRPSRDDAATFADLYPKLRRYAALWAGRDAEPDDLVQQALANALQAGSLTTLANPEAYLRATIANIAKNQFRRRGSRPGEVLAAVAADESFEDSYPSDIRWILELTPEERAALFLVDVEGHSYEDAASQMGMRVGSLTSLLRRARRKSRRILDRQA